MQEEKPSWGTLLKGFVRMAVDKGGFSFEQGETFTAQIGAVEAAFQDPAYRQVMYPKMRAALQKFHVDMVGINPILGTLTQVILAHFDLLQLQWELEGGTHAQNA